jgi:Rrf2 family protein
MLTKRAKYALQALVQLARDKSGEPVRIETLASRGRIPKKFLEGILLDLKNGGLLSSKKGKGGGYSLETSPEKISVGEVIRLIDGPLAPLSCVSKTAYAPCEDCEDVDSCGIRMVMRQAHDASMAILESAYLSDMIQFTTDSSLPRTEALMYYI